MLCKATLVLSQLISNAGRRKETNRITTLNNMRKPPENPRRVARCG